MAVVRKYRSMATPPAMSGVARRSGTLREIFESVAHGNSDSAEVALPGGEDGKDNALRPYHHDAPGRRLHIQLGQLAHVELGDNLLHVSRKRQNHTAHEGGAMSMSEAVYRMAPSRSVRITARTPGEDLSLSSASCTTITSLSVSRNVV